MTADSASRVDRLLEELEHFGVKLGLERMRRVLAELGSPERGLPVVLVAGTNGKGSTSAWVASIVSAAGYRSGLFTSPHLERVEERLRLDGRRIDSARLESLLTAVLAASRRTGGEVVTYFEAMTAAALCYFRQEKVDLAVMEVGLGGRLDATNVTDPVLSLVTQISFDHQRQLGNSLAEIATEKAGILRRGREALSSATEPAAVEALRQAARERGGELAFTADLIRVDGRRDLAAGGQVIQLSSASKAYELEPTLSGGHQVENLSLAVAAAERLSASGFGAIDSAAVRRGIGRCRWPGRLEWVHMSGGATVLLDAAHNPAGLEALSTYLSWLERPFGLVFGMLREKVDAAVVRRLWDLAERTWITQPESARALRPAELVELVGSEPDALVVEPAAALALAIEESPLVVVCGSLYLVGELRTWLHRTHGVPPASDELFGATWPGGAAG